MRKIKYIFLFTALAFSASAQDPHHSQYFNLPAYFNPAATGQGVEHIRATAVYRQQWPSLESPFVTQGIIFDKQVSRVGLGALLNKNSAGPAGIKRMQFGGMVSYRQKIESHQVAAGIYTGLIQKSFDPSEMTFDDQYNDDAGYSAANQTSEYFAFTKVVRPDFGAGILWTMGEEEKAMVKSFAGVSVMHINQPHEVFIDEQNTTPMKKSVAGGASIVLNEHVTLKPSAMYSMQQASEELMYGCLATLQFEERNAVEAGIYMRHNESGIAYAGYRWNSFMAGLSYDMTLSNSVNGPGAFELTLTYIPKAKAKKEKKAPEKTAAAKPPATVKKTTAPANKPATTPPAKEAEKKVITPPAPVVEQKPPVRKEEKTIAVNPAPVQKQEPKPAKEIAVQTQNKPAEVKKAPVVKQEQKPAPVIHETPKTPVAKPELAAAKPDVKKEIKAVPAPAKATTVPVKKEVVPRDRDKDGVPDSEDRCPDKAGLASDNGCPAAAVITDADGDGVLNAEDECPYIKGSAATKGCPDTDGDGIIDSKDRCPMYKGDAANEGCPAKDIYKDAGSYIKFDINSAHISGFDVIDILEPVSDSLYNDAATTIIISGHTDSEGDAYYNMILSQNRAEAVKAYFIKHGVRSDRIQTIGYGETKPLEPNDTEEGRKVNRRAEIYILKQNQ